MTDPIALCAEGEAAWHRFAYDSLGSGWADDGRLARAADTVPHPFLLGAVTLTPEATVPDEVPGIVCDSYARLSLPGRRAEPTGHWMVRSGGAAAPVSSVPGLSIRRAETDDDVVWFEAVAGGSPCPLPQNGASLRRVGALRWKSASKTFAFCLASLAGIG